MKRKAKKERINWDGAGIASIEKATEGGMGGSFAMFLLKEAGIPCRRAYSPYIGQTGVEVPKKFKRRAFKILGVA